jgi:hypothetical protein
MAARKSYEVGKITVSGPYAGTATQFQFLVSSELAAVKLAAPAAEKYRKTGPTLGGGMQYIALGLSGAVQTVVTVREV